MVTENDPNRMVNEYETFEQQQAQMTRNFELTGHCGTFPKGDIPGYQPWRKESGQNNSDNDSPCKVLI